MLRRSPLSEHPSIERPTSEGISQATITHTYTHMCLEPTNMYAHSQKHMFIYKFVNRKWQFPFLLLFYAFLRVTAHSTHTYTQTFLHMLIIESQIHPHILTFQPARWSRHTHWDFELYLFALFSAFLACRPLPLTVDQPVGCVPHKTMPHASSYSYAPLIELSASSCGCHTMASVRLPAEGLSAARRLLQWHISTHIHIYVRYT